MKHGSLFSGIGGFDLAAEWMGWDNVFHCEWEPFPRQVLHHYWPNAISYEDIRQTDFTIHRGQIDILTGGFPCQPYSQAGKRLGKEDDRHLWPEMLRAIREIQPQWIVGENVLGLANWNGGLVFEEVQADLEAEGYEIQPYVLPAAGVNAPHQRYRIWFVAHTESNGNSRKVHRGRIGRRQKSNPKERGNFQYELYEHGKVQPTSDTDHARANESLRTDGNGQEKNKRRKGQPQFELGKDGSKRCTSNTNNTGLQGSEIEGGFGEVWQEPNEFPSGFIRTNWKEFPTQSPICGGDDGIPIELDGITFPKWRNESIKAYGNAVVPQVVLQIFKAIQQYENQYA